VRSRSRHRSTSCRSARARDERGQALAVVVGMLGLLVALPLSVQLLATGQLPIGAKASDMQDAEVAAHAGLADYINHLQGPYSYLTHCSTGFTSLTTGLTTGQTDVTSISVSALPAAAAGGDRIQIGSGSSGTQTVTVDATAASGVTTIQVHAFNPEANYASGTPVFDMTLSPGFTTTWTCPSGAGPDPDNPAFADYPDDGHWVIVHNAGPAGYGAFQYVVDAANTVGAGLGGIAAQHLIVYVTGRGGVPGHYVYSTLEVTLALSPLVFSSADCSNTGYELTVPATATSAVIELWGAEGGGAGGQLFGSVGHGGDGDQITVYPPVTPGQTWVADPGQAGASGDFSLVTGGQEGLGGTGCSGSLNSSGGNGGVVSGLGAATVNGGGGGGASAVCFGTTTTCNGAQDANGICTDAYVTGTTPANEPSSSACVIGMAGGGGGNGGGVVGLMPVGGYGGFWGSGGTWTANGQNGSNVLGLGAAKGGTAGANPKSGTSCGSGTDDPNTGGQGSDIDIGAGVGGGGGGGGGWCGGNGGAAGGVLGLALGTGGAGGVGGSAAMPDPSSCPSVFSAPITGYPVSFGGNPVTGSSNGDGAIMIAFFSGANCPGNVLQYSASVELVQPIPPNTA